MHVQDLYVNGKTVSEEMLGSEEGKANRVRKYLGETGIRILMRLIGLVLTALAVQFVLNGMMDLRIVTRG
jgi:hypothetical protein